MGTTTTTRGLAGSAILLAFFAVLLAGMSFPKEAAALSLDDEIKAAFQEMLDRDPSAADLVNNRANFTTRAAIKTELNQWPERDLAIHAIYQRALGRAAMERELTQLKQWVAENNRIREQVFNTIERTLAIQNVYRRYLDREAPEPDVDFFEVTRSDVGDILAVLNGSTERRLVLRNIVMSEIGREPTDEELAAFLADRADVVGIARGVRNPLIVKVEDSFGNEQENSWAVEGTGEWSMDEYASGNYPVVTVGDEITFTVNAVDYIDDEEISSDDIVEASTSESGSVSVYEGKKVNYVYYKFTVGNGNDVIQDWSTTNTATWTVDADHVGRQMPVTAWVKDNNSIERMGSGLGDDYTYLTYQVQSGSDNGDATITSVTDSEDNVQEFSWTPDGQYQWSEYPELTVGDELTFTVNATDPEGDAIMYRFIFYGADGSGTTVQDWSADSTYVWDISSSDIGPSVNVQVGVKDDNDILAAGDNGDDWLYMTYKVLGGGDNENATLVSVVDSLGNTQNKSAAGEGDDTYQWSEYPMLEVGEMITFTAAATDTESDDLEYKFMLFDYGGSGTVVQDWSSVSTYQWTITDDYVGPNINMMVAVRDDNGEEWFGESNGDDWLYLTYQVWE
ncbi:MAG: hypothetical protein WC505_03955 [Patescibacteria group bacterium]